MEVDGIVNLRRGLHRTATRGDGLARGAQAAQGMAPPDRGGLGLTEGDDVGGLTRPECIGLLPLATQRLTHTPEVGAGPLIPGLNR